MSDRLPIGVCLGTIGADFRWWRDSARRLEAAGYSGVWAWDHFISRGPRTDPVLECWTTLTGAACATNRISLGTFVLNVMNRHPAVVARQASTFQEVSGGRLVLGVGIGGHEPEHLAMGIPFPPPAERVARLEEAVAVIRALWNGGPVSMDGEFYPLREAHAFPRPSPMPQIIVGGETRGGARLAARIGDGWTAFDRTFEQNEPIYRETLASLGKDRASMRVIVAFESGRAGHSALPGSPWVADPRGTLESWRARGADEAIVTARTTEDVDLLVDAVGRW